MRQRLNVKQLDELSEHGRERLLFWEQDHLYTFDEYLEPPTIGLLIEFISDYTPKEVHFELLREKVFDGKWGMNNAMWNLEEERQFDEILDLLWEYAKVILERE